MDEVRYSGEKVEVPPPPSPPLNAGALVGDDDEGHGPEYKYSQVSIS
jgi:hypothetical protein